MKHGGKESYVPALFNQLSPSKSKWEHIFQNTICLKHLWKPLHFYLVNALGNTVFSPVVSNWFTADFFGLFSVSTTTTSKQIGPYEQETTPHHLMIPVSCSVLYLNHHSLHIKKAFLKYFYICSKVQLNVYTWLIWNFLLCLCCKRARNEGGLMVLLVNKRMSSLLLRPVFTLCKS